jgi:uncharacterized protein YdeI (YjbR/CyaY-like superfamily)
MFHKRHTGRKSISYDDAVEEAICFGWVDSLVKRLDADRYARKFTLRKADSSWSAINRKRYAKLKSLGLLAEPGRARAPTNRRSIAPRRLPWPMPPYIETALKANKRAQDYFNQLAPSYRRRYIGWIDSAKREETKLRRLREAIKLLAARRKLGLK